MLDDIRRVAIVGTGLLGASVGLGLRAAGYRGSIVGVGRRRDPLDEAVAAGAIEEGVTDFAHAAAETDLAVVAVPLGAFDSVFADIAPHDHDRLIISDVGSTKASVVAAAARHLPNPARFCGAHPMAGSEQQGPAAGRADLFADKPCILTPRDSTDPRAIETVEALWRGLGMTLLRMTPEQHDRHTAVVSHLPHLLAVLLMRVVGEQGGWDVASTGLRDTSRLASSNPPMRRDILRANRTAVGEALACFANHLDALRGVLAEEADEALLQTLTDAKQTRDHWLDPATADAACLDKSERREP
jgi:prephenate dehydrogenase